MEVVAPAEVTAAPFAMCPRFNLLAVGMASPAASRGDAEGTGASRVDVLRLLRPTGDHDLESTLQVDCFLRAPGLTSLAWSSTPTKRDDSPFTPIEQDLYPAGLLAGGFDDGAVRIWNPAPAMLCDLRKSSVTAKPKAELILNEDPVKARQEETEISTGISDMYSDILKGTIRWTYSEGKDSFHTEEEESTDWELVENDAGSSGWEVICKEQPVANHHKTTKMKLLTETKSPHGPVLGLSFNELYPYWIGIGASGECISVHDLHFPLQLSKEKRELCDSGSSVNTQITCLKWKIWDVRKASGRSMTKLTAQDKPCSSDLEFSWNNPMHVAVSSKASATVKIWDMRKPWDPFHEYASGGSGVVSLSWNRLGQLLTSHTNGGVSCYDVYKKKMVQEVGLPHCDLGLTWTHSENVAALLSSKNGVKLYEVGG